MERFRFWCQKVLPLVYDDSLSYYELLCKVVDYLNKMGEIVNEVSEEISNINKFIQENTEKVVLETMEKWLEDGTLEEVFGKALKEFTKHGSNVTNMFVDTELLFESKIDDVAQGFCTDGTAFYMVHHSSDLSPLKLLKTNMKGSIQFDKNITTSDGKNVTGIHGNSLCYYDGKLICAYAGDNYTKLLVIDPITAVANTVTTGLHVSAIDFCTVDGEDYAFSVWSNSQNIVTSWVKGHKMLPFSRYMQKYTVPNLKQGLLATDSHVYIPYSANGAYKFNVVRVYTHGLQNSVNIYFNQFNDCEMEDLARVEDDEVMYWNDIDGNIYSFKTDGLFTQSQDITSFSEYAQALDHYVYRLSTTAGAFNKVHTSNGVSVLTEFSVPPVVRRTWSMSGYGYLNVLGGTDTPIVLTPTTGDILVNCTTDVWNGAKYRPVCLKMRYKYDESNSKYQLTYFLMSCHDLPEYVYTSSASTEANLQDITKWVHDRFSSMSKLTDLGMVVFNTTLNVGAGVPITLW